MRLRRRRAESHPQRQRRLSRPVISVGNLSMGGTGKTPVVAAIARHLIERGEKPSILSRGYGRSDAVDGVVVVCDGAEVRGALEQSGDEPLMLARQVPRAVVCVSPDRYLAGVLAESAFGCTVHVLDDGFQHVELARNLDILVTTIGEIPDGRVIPAGRLREPMDAAARAHVLVVSDATAGAASAEAWTLGIQQSCGAVRSLAGPVLVGRREPGAGNRESGAGIRDLGVLAIAGIAHPQRFFDGLKAAGYTLVGEMRFRDHHRYTAADVAAIDAQVKTAGADIVFTTDKDAVRLEGFAPFAFDLYRVPVIVEFDPPHVLFDAVRAVLQ